MYYVSTLDGQNTSWLATGSAPVSHFWASLELVSLSAFFFFFFGIDSGGWVGTARVEYTDEHALYCDWRADRRLLRALCARLSTLYSAPQGTYSLPIISCTVGYAVHNWRVQTLQYAGSYLLIPRVSRKEMSIDSGLAHGPLRWIRQTAYYLPGYPRVPIWTMHFVDKNMHNHQA